MKTPTAPMATCGTAIYSPSRSIPRAAKKKPPTVADELLAELMQELAVRDMSRRSDARKLRTRLS